MWDEHNNAIPSSLLNIWTNSHIAKSETKYSSWGLFVDWTES